MTLIETLLVVSAAALLLVATAAYSIPWIARESMRSSVYDLQTYLQLARIEAVSRNRDCRFVVDTSSRTLQVWDSNGTTATSDDTRLYNRALPTSVSFARPDGGSAVTYTQIGAGSSYQVVFTSDGTVSSGTGEAVVFGGQSFAKIEVFGAGGTRMEKWNGSGWVSGS
jgi:Tfp pilus assembly protein FimT